MNINAAEWERNILTLEDLADVISEKLACSVTVEDTDHKLLAYSYHSANSDPARISTIVGRRVPERVIQSLWHSGAFERIRKAEGPVRIAAIAEVGLGDRVAVAICNRDTVLGYIWVAEEDRLLDEQGMELLRHAARTAASRLMAQRTNAIREARAHRDFFWQLLNGHFRTDEEIREEASRYRLQLPPLYTVHVLPVTAAVTEKVEQQLRDWLAAALGERVILHVLDHNRQQLILLTDDPSGKPNARVSDLRAALTETIQMKYGLDVSGGGCGTTGHRYSRLSACYGEALSVVQLKRIFPDRLHAVYRYADLGFYRLLPGLAEAAGEEASAAYTHPGLAKLEQYDRTHNGNLLATLEALLVGNGSIKATADALCVHENTLSYRLKRIAEIGGIDVNSIDEQLACYLEIRLRQYAERTKIR